MAISQIIKFEGSPDDLVWKFSGEEFNATSQLLVEETHQALLVVNGQAADLFGSGRHTLTVPKIPLLNKIISIPTGGQSPFQCKVFYVNQVHQMEMLWGTRGPITLDDPIYKIFLHVMLNGSMTFSISDSRKFLIKLCGFRSRYTRDEMIENFKGLVSSHVKDCISKIMINGNKSYFHINADLFETSEIVKERLDGIFDEYGIRIEYFNIETIEVPKDEYEAINKAKERRTAREIEGYTWQEERQMDIAKTFAGNEGTIGNVGGAVGGFMMGGAMGGAVVDIAKSAMSPDRIPSSQPQPPANNNPGFDVKSFLRNGGGSVPPQTANSQPQMNVDMPGAVGGQVCPNCGNNARAGSKFCNECGYKFEVQSSFCPECGSKTVPGSKFCNECGFKLI